MVVVGEEDGECEGSSHNAWSWRNGWQDGCRVEGHVMVHEYRARW